ncbi:LOW QUALITY PROTEIN: membrane-associated guanylate kinase, WW and PDZ domain-containing protein 1-like [Centruroides vittatus]|uniref:LOW QUALITY PROTEIN: membrane-associated guanylate kinase, WW and PDZ domain-containing protein 1-like n=1 Tax=Centruroides vittatus TaxID=120091 RepID=UPI00350F5B7B
MASRPNDGLKINNVIHHANQTPDGIYKTATPQWQDTQLLTQNHGLNENEVIDVSMSELPYGWEKIEDPHYGTYYIDHVNKTTQYESPLSQVQRNQEDTIQKLPYIFTRNPYELKGEMIQTTLVKSARGFGFTIVGGDNGDVEEFLQIKNIVPHGPAWQNGILQTGDVLVYVNRTCVLGYTHQDVVTLFQTMSPGDSVQLEVCRGYPLPFDLSDPNAEVVSTMAVSVNQSPENRPLYNDTADPEVVKEEYFKLDDGSDSARSAKSMPDLRNSNPSKIQRHSSADILDNPTAEMSTFNQQQNDFSEYITVEIIKGNNGFGFTIADSGCGQKVKKILDKNRCKSLQEGDVLLEINGKSVTNASHTDVVLTLKECPCGEAAKITVQRMLKGNKYFRSHECNNYEMDGNSNLVSQSLLCSEKIKPKDITIPSVPGSYRSKTPTADLYSSKNKETVSVNRPKTPLMDTRNWSPEENSYQGYNSSVDQELLSMWKTGFRIKSPNSQPNWSVIQDQPPYWFNKNFQESNKNQDCLQCDGPLQNFKNIPEIDELKSIQINNRGLYNTNNWDHANLGNINAGVQSYPKFISNRYLSDNSYLTYSSDYSNCQTPQIISVSICLQKKIFLVIFIINTHQIKVTPTKTNNSLDQEQQPLLSKVLSEDSEYNMYRTQTIPDSPELNEMIVTLHRQESGFGFRIVGGTEEGSQVSIGHIVPGGSADLDGRLRPGDEIISVDGQSVINTTHHHVVQLMGNASINGIVTLGIKRDIPPRNIESLPDSYANHFTDLVYPYNITVTRKQNEGFGFVIISSVNRIGSTIGRILENSPAERCGQLRVGDRILAVNGISIIHMHHGDIVNLIKDSGFSVTLTIGAPQDDDESSTTSNSQKGEESQTEQCYHSVELLRGTRGFGFSIRGGQEFQNMPLYVLRIAENGPAHQSGKLQIGDQIMEINGINTSEMTHAEAIEIIRQGGNSVSLLVKRHDKLPAAIANNPGSLPPDYYSIIEQKEITR